MAESNSYVLPDGAALTKLIGSEKPNEGEVVFILIECRADVNGNAVPINREICAVATVIDSQLGKNVFIGKIFKP